MEPAKSQNDAENSFNGRNVEEGNKYGPKLEQGSEWHLPKFHGIGYSKLVEEDSDDEVNVSTAHSKIETVFYISDSYRLFQRIKTIRLFRRWTMNTTPLIVRKSVRQMTGLS